jgi:hypothetical protein
LRMVQWAMVQQIIRSILMISELINKAKNHKS